MTGLKKKYFALFFLSVFTPLLVYSIRSESYTTITQGLSNNYVICSARDHLGFLWFGTPNGLNRYDGYDFRIFYHNPDDSSSISNNIIRSIYVDYMGNLWIGTDEGLNMFDYTTETFVRFMPDPSNYHALSDNMVQCILIDRQKTLWVGTFAGGINFRKHNSDKFFNFRHDKKKKNTISSDNITCILEDNDGDIWIGTDKAGINRYNPEEQNFIVYNNNPDNLFLLSDNRIKRLFQDSRGNIWVGTAAGLNRLIKKGNTVYFEKYFNGNTGTKSNYITDIFEDSRKQLWVSYLNGGVFLFDSEKKSFTPKIFGQHEEDKVVVNCVLEDGNDNIWLGTTMQGLTKINLRAENFHHYKKNPGKANSLSSNIINGLYEEPDGTLWVATMGGGLNKIDKQGKITIYKAMDYDDKALVLNDITSVMVDNHGNLWAGTTMGILFIRKDQLLKKAALSSDFFVSGNGVERKETVRSIMQDRQGIIWAATLHGILKIDWYNNISHPRIELFNTKNAGLSSVRTWSICESDDSTLWIATSNGLNKFNKKSKRCTTFLHIEKDKHSLSVNAVKSLYCDSRGYLWVGTMGGGLNRFDYKKEEFVSFTTKDGLPDNVVYGIVPDPKTGNLWLSTNKGLSCYSMFTGTFINYDVHDGLQSNQFRQGAYASGHSGYIYFGGINGFNAFHPDSIRIDPKAPEVVFTGLKIYNKPIMPGQKIKGRTILQKSISLTNMIIIPAGVKMITIEFTALHFKSPQKNKYMYMLEGFDKEWVKAEISRHAVYTNLPEGRYVFKVNASNADGIWNKQIKTLHITVLPPLYARRWFVILVVVLLVLLLVAFIVLLRKRSLRLHAISVGTERDLLQTLMDNIPDSIYFKDKNSRFIKINRAKANSIGISHPDDVIGKSDFDYFSKEDAQETYNDEQHIMSTGKPLVNKIEKRKGADGLTYYYSATKVPLFDTVGNVMGTMGITRDITSQIKANEELKNAIRKAEEADKLKSAFLANMSHEIRTPMNAIIGFSDLLNDPQLTQEEMKTYIQYIRNNSEVLLHLIEDIVDSAKIEANQLKINQVYFDLNKLIDETYMMFKHEKTKKEKDHIQLYLHKAISDDRFMIYSDPYRLKQILYNLLGNALKFTETGSIEFGYSFLDQNTLLFYVKDTGIGIPKEKFDVIFPDLSKLGQQK